MYKGWAEGVDDQKLIKLLIEAENQEIIVPSF
jgi:hypothetical protein